MLHVFAVHSTGVGAFLGFTWPYDAETQTERVKLLRAGVSLSIHVPSHPGCLCPGNNRKNRSSLEPAGLLFQKNNRLLP